MIRVGYNTGDKTMKILITLPACCMALALSWAVQAEIYESTNAQGNPVFTDTPTAGAEKVDLPQENIADAVRMAPQPEPVDASATPVAALPEPAVRPEESENVAVIPNTRNEELERGVAADMPREVGDIPSEEEMQRREDAMSGQYIDENGNRVRVEHRGHAGGRR